MKKKNNETFSGRLYNLRKKKLALNQETLAKKMGLSSITICLYETGKRGPNVVFFQKMKKKWNVNLNWLISGKGDMFVRDNKE